MSHFLCTNITEPLTEIFEGTITVPSYEKSCGHVEYTCWPFEHLKISIIHLDVSSVFHTKLWSNLCVTVPVIQEYHETLQLDLTL